MEKVLSTYEINIHGLEEKVHAYEFEGSDEFFEAFDQDIIASGEFRVKVVLDKTATMLRLSFDIEGKLDLICDRSLKEFEEPLLISEKYIYKYGDRNEVISDEIEIIPFGTPKINIAQHIFDFISLSVPMKKLHPDFRAEEEDVQEEGVLVYTDQVQGKQGREDEQQDAQEPDPRWAALLKLKNKD